MCVYLSAITKLYEPEKVFCCSHQNVSTRAGNILMQWPESPKLWTRKHVSLQSPKNVCTRCLVVVTTTYESVEINHVSHFQAAWERCPSKSIWQNRKHWERTINQSVQHVCCTWSVMLKPMLMCWLCVSSLKLIKISVLRYVIRVLLCLYCSVLWAAG